MSLCKAVYRIDIIAGHGDDRISITIKDVEIKCEELEKILPQIVTELKNVGRPRVRTAKNTIVITVQLLDDLAIEHMFQVVR